MSDNATKAREGDDDHPGPGPQPGSPDDFDGVAWFYDWTPVPTHPKRLAPHLSDVEGVVVDLGGGTGKYTPRFTDPARHAVLVVDPARKMLQKGRRKRRPFAPVQGIGESLPLADRSVAAVVATEAFHHLGDGQEATLREVVRVLRDDGTLLIEEPDPTRWTGRFFGWMERKQKMTSVFHPPARIVADLERLFYSVTLERASWLTYLATARGPRRGPK